MLGMTQMARRGRLQARPSLVNRPAPLGLQSLSDAGLTGGYVYVPASYECGEGAPALLLLQGSGGHAHYGLEMLQQLAEETGLILIAPASADYTWDVILSRFGEDVSAVERTLRHVFATYQIDASRLAVGGFSDGAAFALLLGLANGDLFGHIIAFSPCVVTLDWAIGQPRVFVSHGTRDELAPASCTKQILAQLERMDLDVEYTEFEGGHRIPPQIARHAIEWLTAADESAREPCLSRSAENRPPREG